MTKKKKELSKKVKKYSRLALKTGTEAGKKVIKTKLIVIGLILFVITVGIVVVVQVFPFTQLANGGGDYPVIPDPAPDPPELYAIDSPNSDGSIDLIWSSETYATQYAVFVDSPVADWEIVIVISSTTYTYNIVEDKGGIYYFKIMASGTGGESPFSNVETVVVEIPYPVLHEIVPNPNFDGNIVLRWDRPPAINVVGYKIWSSIKGTEDWELIKQENDESITTYTHTITESGTYYFIMKAAYLSGSFLKWTPLGNIVEIEVILDGNGDDNGEELPEVPFLKEISPSLDTDGNIYLDWDSVERADNYEIQKSINGGIWNILQAYDYDTDGTDYTDSGLEDGNYQYKVRAKNSYGYSSFSIVRSVVVDLPDPVIILPTNPSIIINSGADTTDSFDVILTLDCDNAEQMRFKIATDEDWTMWESFSTTKSITLPESSVDNPFYSIKVQFSNSDGETGENDAIDGIIYVPLGGNIPEEPELPITGEQIIIIVVAIGGSIVIIILIQRYRKIKKRRPVKTKTPKQKEKYKKKVEKRIRKGKDIGWGW